MNLRINHRIGDGIVNVKFFNSFSLDLKYDSVASTFNFRFYFDPMNKQHAELACVSHFHEAIVEHNGETLITGFILTQKFIQSSVKNMVEIAGYSKTGVLGDCEIPPSLYPLQNDGLSLEQIATRLIAPFRLKLINNAGATLNKSVNKKIKKTTASHSQNIISYLSEIAQQRNVVLTHNEFGDLVITDAKTDGLPIMDIKKGGLIGTTLELTFNGQPIHSHITIIKQASADGGNGGEYTIRNPYCPVAYVYRPRVIEQSSGDEFTVQETAANALALELKNITLIVTIDMWDLNGKIIRPNNTITVYSPEIFLYKKTTWFIESINYTGNEKETIATLTCVLPEVYNKKIPKNIFVDSHENLPRF